MSDFATKQDIQDLKQELKQEFRQDLKNLADMLTELARQVETNLLTAFHSYAKGQSARMHSTEVANSALAERMAALEERVLNLETRRH